MADAASVLREALSLDQRARADVAAELLASLDDVAEDNPERVEAQWTEELARRAGRAASHPEESEDWAVVRRRVLDALRD